MTTLQWKPSCSMRAGGWTDRQTQADRQTDRYGEVNSRFSEFGKAPIMPCFNIQNLWDITPFFFSSKHLPTLRRNVIPLSSSKLQEIIPLLELFEYELTVLRITTRHSITYRNTVVFIHTCVRTSNPIRTAITT